MKLLVLDVEGTLFKNSVKLPGTNLDSTIWQAIAYSLGKDAVEEEVKTHEKWGNGEYGSYLDWMKETILIHKKYKLRRSLFNELVNSSKYNEGVVETLKKIDRNNYEIALVSGGFRELTARAQRDLGIIHAFAACEYFFGNNDLIESFNLLPCDFEGKIDFINLMLKEYGLGTKDWLFIGDGGNDVPIAKLAPLSIGYRPHPQLQKVVNYSINDFSEILRFI